MFAIVDMNSIENSTNLTLSSNLNSPSLTQSHLMQLKQQIPADVHRDFDHFSSVDAFIHAERNPTKLTNAYSQWVVQHQLSPYDIANCFDVSSSHKPLWGWQRMGQTQTTLPDGRVIYIGGEYEDFYDPQFAIYADVVVQYPDGQVDVFAYPHHVFCPTDFHTATLVGDEIWIIGSVGYPEDVRYQQTSVYRLNVHTYKIEIVATRNQMGWVSHHLACLKDNQIIVSGGEIRQGIDLPMRENIDVWALNLRTLIWKNLTQRQWQGFYVYSLQRPYFHLWHIKHLTWLKQYDEQEYHDTLDELALDIGKPIDLDLYQQLFSPPITHDVDMHEQTYNTVTIIIDDIRVRYVDEDSHIMVYVEGQLTAEKLELLQVNLCHKLSKLENCQCQIGVIEFH